MFIFDELIAKHLDLGDYIGIHIGDAFRIRVWVK